MRYLTLGEVVALHRAVIERTGGASGIRDLGSLESALAQPRASFGGADLHASLPAKAAALGFSLTLNHPFLDGNKRTAHAAMEALREGAASRHWLRGQVPPYCFPAARRSRLSARPGRAPVIVPSRSTTSPLTITWRIPTGGCDGS